MNEYMNFWDKIFSFFIGIWDSFYQSVIHDNRYEYILEGLFNTVIIALLAVIIGTIIGVIIAGLFTLIGYAIGMFKVPEGAGFDLAKKTGGEKT